MLLGASGNRELNAAKRGDFGSPSRNPAPSFHHPELTSTPKPDPGSQTPIVPTSRNKAKEGRSDPLDRAVTLGRCQRQRGKDGE